MPDYGRESRLARATDRAIAAANSVPAAPAARLCGHDGCPLPTGHQDRVGSPHLPPLLLDLDIERRRR